LSHAVVQSLAAAHGAATSAGHNGPVAPVDLVFAAFPDGREGNAL
jgi:hypothetical protein